MYTIPELSAIVAPIARRHNVRKVSVFGNVARGDARPNSDVDLLVDMGTPRTLFQMGGFYADVDDALRCSVDMVSTDSHDHSFLERIRKDEVVIYEQ